MPRFLSLCAGGPPCAQPATLCVLSCVAGVHRPWQVREKKCVVLSKLRKEFAGGCTGVNKVAVDGVDLVLTEGSITVLLGHNGAGAKGSLSHSKLTAPLPHPPPLRGSANLWQAGHCPSCARLGPFPCTFRWFLLACFNVLVVAACPQARQPRCP
jgi:hypothetical protein